MEKTFEDLQNVQNGLYLSFLGLEEGRFISSSVSNDSNQGDTKKSAQCNWCQRHDEPSAITFPSPYVLVCQSVSGPFVPIVLWLVRKQVSSG